MPKIEHPLLCIRNPFWFPVFPEVLPFVHWMKNNCCDIDWAAIGETIVFVVFPCHICALPQVLDCVQTQHCHVHLSRY